MRVAVAVLVLLLAVPGRMSGWGFEAHRVITDRAIDALPAEIAPFYTARRAFIVEHAIDPDLWRNADFTEEPPNHYLDLDYHGYGADPFPELPRDYDAAVQKFGLDVVRAQGLLPWRTQEMYGKLRRAFASLAQPSPPPYALDDIAYFSAIVSHYVADGHVPLHALVNYDGQLTGQAGLHARWEEQLFARFRDRVTIAAGPLVPVGNPRDFMFDVLLASYRAAPEIFAADRQAAAGRELYDDGYFEAFARAELPLVQRRMSDAATAVASMIAAAWTEAGRPSLTLAPRPPRRVKGPGR